MSHVWEVEDVSAGFGVMEGKIEGITLRIEEGEKIAFLGHERSGRALLLRVLGGLRPLRGGRMNVLGEEIKKLAWWGDWDNLFSRNVRKKLGISLEQEGLLSNVSVREGLELLFRFKYGDHSEKLRKGAQQVVASLVVKFGLSDCVDKRPYLLSAAERRLASLARAFLVKPSVILLENPSQSVGDLARERLCDALRTIIEARERTVVMSTDDWAIAHQFCERWIVMEEGKIAFDGKPEQFMKSSHKLVTEYRAYLKLRKQDESFLEETA
jgi:ABC-type multidrug transport system ATPase subunit